MFWSRGFSQCFTFICTTDSVVFLRQISDWYRVNRFEKVKSVVCKRIGRSPALF